MRGNFRSTEEKQRNESRGLKEKQFWQFFVLFSCLHSRWERRLVRTESEFFPLKRLFPRLANLWRNQCSSNYSTLHKTDVDLFDQINIFCLSFSPWKQKAQYFDRCGSGGSENFIIKIENRFEPRSKGKNNSLNIYSMIQLNQYDSCEFVRLRVEKPPHGELFWGWFVMCESSTRFQMANHDGWFDLVKF